MKIRNKTLFNLLTACILGVTLNLSFAPYEIFPFAILATAGLLGLWLNATKWQSFGLGFAFGLGLFGSGVHWIYISMRYFGDVNTSLAIFITCGFIAGLALFPAIVGYVLNRYFPTPNLSKLFAAYPAIWVFSEWIRGWAFTGFPWLSLGYSQTHSPLKGYAPIVSVYGVSLTILLSSSFVVYAVLCYQRKDYQRIYYSFLGLATIWIMGGMLALIPWTKEEGTPMTIGLVQGNIPQSIKWSPENLQLSLDRYAELSQALWGKHDLIIWPESAIPATLEEVSDYINQLDEIAKRNRTTLLLGIPIQTNSGGYYNSIVALGEQQQVYKKRILVPFGEFTPNNPYLRQLFAALNIPTADMVSGNITQAPLNVGGIKILPTICYEIAYPELLASNDKTIGLILTITNDAWFGKSSAQAQHLQIAEMRALELKRPVLFVSNNGITAIINPDGNIDKQIPAYATGVLTGKVQARYGLTPWMTNKMAPLHFILLFMLFIAIRDKYKTSMIEERPTNKMQLSEK